MLAMQGHMHLPCQGQTCGRVPQRQHYQAASATIGPPNPAASGALAAQRPLRRPTPRPRGMNSMAAAAAAASGATGGSGPRVCVAGGGVNGLATALRLLQELPGAQLTVCADKFTPYSSMETTSGGAAGIWGPYKLSDTPDEDVYRSGGQGFHSFCM